MWTENQTQLYITHYSHKKSILLHALGCFVLFLGPVSQIHKALPIAWTPMFHYGSAGVVADVKWEVKRGNRKISISLQWATNHPPLSSSQKGSHAFNCKYWENWVPYQLWYLQLRRAQPEYHRSHTISGSHSSAGSNGSWTERNCPSDQHQLFDPRIEKRK